MLRLPPPLFAPRSLTKRHDGSLMMMGLSLRGSFRRSIGWVGVFAVAAASGICCAWAQGGAPAVGETKTMVVMPPTPLLPTSDTLVAASPEFPVPDDSTEAQTILKEDGLTRSERRAALAGTTSRTAVGGWVKAYEFTDATGAFSAYTYLRMGDNVVAGRARTDARSAGKVRVFLSGTTVVIAKLNLRPEAEDALLNRIDVGLPKVGGRRALAPLLPAMLPADVAGTKLDVPSVRYALGPAGYQAMGGALPADILGWDKSAEVAVADYAGHGSKGTLTLLLYPTPQVSGDRGRAIEKAINDKGTATFGTVKMRRVGPLVGVTSGDLKPDQAQALVEALHLQQIVSFDKPMPLEFHAEVRKTATLLQSILIFTGLLTLAAIVLGVFLGGARAGIRVLRGKSAAADPEFLTINLRDQPKGLFAPKDEGAGKPVA